MPKKISFILNIEENQKMKQFLKRDYPTLSSFSKVIQNTIKAAYLFGWVASRERIYDKIKKGLDI